MSRLVLLCVLLGGCGFGDNRGSIPGESTCGDGTQDPGEGCDDRNTTDGDGCSADCAVESADPECGNGVREVGEPCDLGEHNGMNMGCSENCTVESVCGNDVHEAGEACEDGNTESGDGCSASCQIESGTSCQLVPQDGCDAGDACDITNDNTTSCRNVTTQGTADSRCTSATGCAIGFSCREDEAAPTSRACAKFCKTNADCGTLSRCAFQAVDDAGDPLNAKVCSNQCAILGQTGCPTGYGCIGLDSASDDFTHCRVMGGAAEGATCLEDSDCTAGSVCADDGQCHKYCNVDTGSTCTLPSPDICNPLTPALTINGTTYGYCLL